MKTKSIPELEPGEEIAIIQEPGHLVCAGHYVTLGLNPLNQAVRLYRRPDGQKSCGAFDIATGKVRPGMYPNPYWISCNPADIRKAKQGAERKRKAREKAERIASERRAQATPIAEELTEDENIESLAGILARRLNPRQIETLRKWLNV